MAMRNTLHMGGALCSVLVVTALAARPQAAGSDVADAAQRKDTTALRALVDKRGDVNAAQADGTTALLWSVHWNDAEAVKLLLRAGANPAAANRFGASPLSEAATSASAEVIGALLDGGADAKALSTADGETVLMTAARAGNLASTASRRLATC